MFIFFFADLGAQSMNDDDYDPSRTVRNIIIGAGVKIFINQLIFAPGINIYFFSMQALLAGDGISGAVQRVQDTLLTSWINSCKIWPFVMAFSLSFVPLEYRSLFTGAINVFWQGYLSLLNRWAEAREAEAAEPLVAAPIALVEAA
ncbi:PXMP2/4 family protein 4 [Trichoderma asperellum]|uniref:PXMP2/4 family protein 4 n=1 Tax=Trichoderma asperellum TaxID=101201 RepID=A0A6V8QUL1_TRIAP|nr:PXMP2/4 family protein 4 [Trichoderma asperellum]